jgi:hypothetical protein
MIWPGQKNKILSPKSITAKRARESASQAQSPEFKPQYHLKKKKKLKNS